MFGVSGLGLAMGIGIQSLILRILGSGGLGVRNHAPSQRTPLRPLKPNPPISGFGSSVWRTGAHKTPPPPQDFRRALDLGLPYGARGSLFLVREIPLYRGLPAGRAWCGGPLRRRSPDSGWVARS